MCWLVRRLAVVGQQRIQILGDLGLHAKLGFLLGAFSKTIETEITKNLDALLAHDGKVAHKPAHKAAPAATHKAMPAKKSHKPAGK